MDEVVAIQLTQGKVALIDRADLPLTTAYSWYAWCDKKSGLFYACAKTKWPDGRRRVLGLHRLILDAPDGVRVDHISGDTLDCRRPNLRLATAGQNRANARHNKNNSSGYRGVYARKDIPNYYAVYISTGTSGRPKFIGASSDPVKAAKMYDTAAKEAYGEFATLNFPESSKITAPIINVPVMKHRDVRTDNSSGFRGVTKDTRVKTHDVWVAQISVNSKMCRIGSFLDKEQAARAYDAAARAAFGSNARLNFPDSEHL